MTRTLPAVLSLLIYFGAIGRAQDITTANPVSGPAAETSAAQPAAEVPATLPTRQKPFYKKVFSLQALYSTVPSAIVQQWHDWPDEWGTRRIGFEKRVASLYGQFVIGSILEDGVKAVHAEDTRYTRLSHGNFFQRTGHAVVHTFLATNPRGRLTPAYSLLANSYGSWAIATLWSPREYRTPASIAEWGTAGMGATVSTNVIREFWPDIKGLFHRSK